MEERTVLKKLIEKAITLKLIDFDPSVSDDEIIASIGEWKCSFEPPEPDKIWDDAYMRVHTNGITEEICDCLDEASCSVSMENGFIRDYLFSHIVHRVTEEEAVAIFKAVYLEGYDFPETEDVPRITKKVIKDGIRNGKITFIVDPNMESGTVCKIGEYWFYFGEENAAVKNPTEYLLSISREELVETLFTTLEEFRKDESMAGEYWYYASVLTE